MRGYTDPRRGPLTRRVLVAFHGVDPMEERVLCLFCGRGTHRVKGVVGQGGASATLALAKVPSIAPVEKSVGGPKGHADVRRVADAENFVEWGAASIGDHLSRRL